MSTDGNHSFEIRLKNAAGVPVLQLGGALTRTALEAVRSTLERLAGAGHYHVVINLERVQSVNSAFLDTLAGAVRNIRSHYGAVDLVVTQERIRQLLRADKLAELFRLSQSERHAIGRIKRLQRPPDGVYTTNARIQEKP